MAGVSSCTVIPSMRDGFRLPVCTVLVIVLLLAVDRASSQVGSNLAPAPDPDCAADSCTLLAFKKQLRNEGEPSLSSWGNKNVTEWTGVTWISGADGALHVEKLELYGLPLEGSIQSLLQEGLTNLLTLNISGCNISSYLPSTLPPALQVLDLSNNFLRGTLPSSLGNLSSLVRLNLSDNKFFESISSAGLGNLLRLEMLDLSGNNFTGIIPSSLGNCTSLVELNLSGNNFSDVIPYTALKQLLKLTTLDVHDNYITGDLSQLLGDGRFPHLTTLDMSGNRFVGFIPDTLGNLSALVFLDLHSNNLTGGIPGNLGNLSNLVCLNLGSNQLSGAIPSSLATLSKLETLDLHFTNLSGHIPESLGGLSSLTLLQLQTNTLTGFIPSSFVNLTGLVTLNLAFNKLNGTIPNFSGLKNLSTVKLNFNKLTGPISPNLTTCLSLQSLWLGDNPISSAIPPELGNLINLVALSLSGSRFNQSIPTELGKLTKLVALDLSYNKLTGPIPDVLCGLKQLQVLLLNNNQLSGTIPSGIANLTQVRSLDLSNNSLTGSIPSNLSTLSKDTATTPDALSTATINNNSSQSGNLVYEFSQAPIFFSFSFNYLTGSIPASIGDIMSLQQLYLNDNLLSGSIPSELGNVNSNLLKLELSHNNLDGPIPFSLTDLHFLSFLNLSYNNLSGEIPQASQFLTFSMLSFLGNPELCGTQVNKACSESLSPKSSPTVVDNYGRPLKKKLLPLYIILACAIVCCFFLGCLYAWSLLRMCKQRNSSMVSDGDPYDTKDDLQTFHVTISCALPSLSPKELAVATGDYDENNIIGDGGFGLVYRAVLNNGAVVAVKKLVEDGVQGQSEFLAEMRTLGTIKHRNLVSLLGYCAYGKERILVYEYMKNGSLDTWLHCRDEGMASLDWRTRLKVMRGAAEGLAFLHHGSSPTIIHRDIKASNILLDCDFEARLADFGLARSARAFESHVSTDFAGTAGYIPPEYSQAGAATTKGDVYSFGVVLLEILTGRRPTDPFFRRREMSHVVTWILNISTEEAMEKTLDMSASASTDEMLELMRIACMCCQETPTKRPNMSIVVHMLNSLEKQQSCSQSASRSPSIVQYDDVMSSPTCR